MQERSFTPEALKATNSVIQRLERIGKLKEYDLQMKEMEKMGTIERLSDEEVKGLQSKVHHFDKLNFTTSLTSNSTPLRVLSSFPLTTLVMNMICWENLMIQSQMLLV